MGVIKFSEVEHVIKKCMPFSLILLFVSAEKKASVFDFVNERKTQISVFDFVNERKTQISSQDKGKSHRSQNRTRIFPEKNMT